MDIIMKKILLLALSIALLSGCANQEALIKQTNSGKPEGEYPGKNKVQVKDALVISCNEQSWIVFESSDSTVICGKENNNVLAQMAVGNAYSTQAMSKVRFSIAEISDSTKVWANMWIESQMPGGQVNQLPLESNQAKNTIQRQLNSIKP